MDRTAVCANCAESNRLPTDLHDVALFYRGRYYAIGTLPAESRYQVDNEQLGSNRGQDLERWFGAGVTPAGGGASTALAGSVQRALRALLFHRHERQGTGAANSGWRHLDQQWRLSGLANSAGEYRDEVLLVGRIAQDGSAEQLNAGSLARLWLGTLPAAGTVRPELRGVLTQVAYLRAYLPVKPREP